MEELKKQLMDQLGLDDLTSNKAIELVIEFIKDKLPENLQGIVDSLISGNDDGGTADGALEAIKGMFGGD